MKLLIVLFVILFLLLPCFPSTSVIETSSTTSYPEFITVSLPYDNTTYAFDPAYDNLTITRNFQISEFRDVTFANVFIQQSGYGINNVEISLQLNDQNATNNYVLSNLADQQSLLFILDDKAMIIPKSTNTLTFSISVSFNPKALWDFTSQQTYSIRFNAITIETSYRQQVPSDSQLNQTNSQFTALIIDPNYQIATQGFLSNKSNGFSLFAYDLEFYIVLPKNIKSTYFLNITISYNYAIDINSLSIDQFGLQTSSQSDSNATYTFRYIDSGQTNSIAKGLFKFNPKSAGIYTFNIKGQFFVTNSFKLFPGSPEMDFFLFINATIIIPMVFLSKLIYRRLFY